MEFIKRSSAQIRAQLGQLTPTQKWLILCLMVILLLSAYLMLQYAARPEMLPITGFAGDPVTVVTKLKDRGIEVRTEGAQIFVRHDQHLDALMVLQQGDLLAADTSKAFDELIKSRSPWLSNELHRQNMLIAKQKVLSLIIGKMPVIRSADVMVSMPTKKGFGETHIQPSASVNVVMAGRDPINQNQVKAIAGLVSGAFSPMRPQDVVVIDASHGLQHTVKNEDDMPPGETLALIKKIEDHYREKIAGFLQFASAIVAVNVQTDPILKQHVIEYDYQTEDQVESQIDKERESRNTAKGGEPGVRSNTGQEIASGSGTMNEQTETESSINFSDRKLTRETKRVELGHATRLINVSVNVPRSYFVMLFQTLRTGQDDQEPTELDDGFIQNQLGQIKEMVEPLIETLDAQGTVQKGIVQAHVIPDPKMLAALMGGEAPSSGMIRLVSSGWIKPIGVTSLALLSLAIMFSMVRKATQNEELPSIEDLAGIPPALGEDDLIGEVGETETSIAGVEVNEGEVRSRKIAQQIGELVNTNPEEAANLLKRWIRTED